jgi:hypothetical protein
MQPRAIATLSRNDTPLTCVITNPRKGLIITEAVQEDSASAKTELTVAPDGQSFQVSVDTVGNYIVGVTVNQIPRTAVNIAEGVKGGALLLAIYPTNVSRTGTFTLAVTA